MPVGTGGIKIIHINEFVFCPDGQGSDARNSIPGIDTQVDQELVHLAGVHQDRIKMSARLPLQMDLFTDNPFEHFDHAFHCLV